MSHGHRHQLTAAEDVARIRSLFDARGSITMLIGRKCMANALGIQLRAAGKTKEAEQKLADMFTYHDAMLEARKDAESWEQRNKK